MVFRSLINRENGYGNFVSRHLQTTDLSSLLEDFECLSSDEYQIGDYDGIMIPPLACNFCRVLSISHILGLADENGFVILYDTRKTGPAAIIKDWLAHNNAVFDLAWMEKEGKLITASGDQTVVMWDGVACQKLQVFKGHTSSVKSVCFRKNDDAVFCSGSRDGHILLFDNRVNKKDGYTSSVNAIRNAHMVPLMKAPKQRRPKLANSKDSQQSVTCVVFQSENMLVSGGAIDGTVKVWDLRKSYGHLAAEPQPVNHFAYRGTSVRKHGITNLNFDSTASRLFVSCMDDTIYQFNCTTYSPNPVAVYRGHRNSSFYVKAAISPCDQFLISGSHDSLAYIWQVDHPQSHQIVLKGHIAEVTAVAWSENEFGKLATLSDDNTMRLWRLHRRIDPLQLGEVSGTAEKTHKTIGVNISNMDHPSPPLLSSQISTESGYESPILTKLDSLSAHDSLSKSTMKSTYSIKAWLQPTLTSPDNHAAISVSPGKPDQTKGNPDKHYQKERAYKPTKKLSAKRKLANSYDSASDNKSCHVLEQHSVHDFLNLQNKAGLIEKTCLLCENRFELSHDEVDQENSIKHLSPKKTLGSDKLSKLGGENKKPNVSNSLKSSASIATLPLQVSSCPKHNEKWLPRQPWVSKSGKHSILSYFSKSTDIRKDSKFNEVTSSRQL